MKDSLCPLVPPRHQQQTVSDIPGTSMWRWAAGCARQLTVMTIQAALYLIGLSITDIPLAIVIGCTAGFLAFVPYVGVSIGLLAALTVALWKRRPAACDRSSVCAGDVRVRAALGCLHHHPARRRRSHRSIGGRRHLSLSLGGTLLGYIGLCWRCRWPPSSGAAARRRCLHCDRLLPGGAPATENGNASPPASGRSPPRASGRSSTRAKTGPGIRRPSAAPATQASTAT